MLVITDQGGIDLVVVEQLTSLSGVLGGDQIHFAQNPQRSLCEILEVAYRRRDQIKRAHGVIVAEGSKTEQGSLGSSYTFGVLYGIMCAKYNILVCRMLELCPINQNQSFL